MSVQEDPLIKYEAPDRPFYATGRLLDDEDFTAEQIYHRGRLARALAYLYGSGTVAGLRVVRKRKTADQEEQLHVEPGLAIDRLGRLIELPRPACIRLQRWFDAQTDDDLVQGLHGSPYNGVVVDIFIRFLICERGKTPAFALGPFDALDATVPSRLRDGTALDLVIRKEDSPPLPENGWPDLTVFPNAGERRTAALNALLEGWQEGTEWRDEAGRLYPLAEHVPGQDPTSLFLARGVILATAGPAEAPRPSRPEGASTLQDNASMTIDNHSRPFIYTPGKWLGRVQRPLI